MKLLQSTIITVLLLASFTGSAQAGDVEKSIYNVQAGTFGIWVNNETRLASRLALRTEVGMDMAVFNSAGNGNALAFTPSIGLEPRWYYNISKRENKGKHTDGNSANFITVAIKYYPDLFVLGDVPGNYYVPDQISFVPKWGIRRSIAQSKFNYEAGLGIGYLRYLSDKRSSYQKSDAIVDIHLRIGYTF